MKKITIIIVWLIIGVQMTGNAQEEETIVKRSILIKTNLLNLVTLRPVLTVEKLLNPHWGVGLSYVSGQFNQILYTDYYRYEGFTLDTRYYFNPLKLDSFSPYVSTYIGYLNRKIRTETKSRDKFESLIVGRRDFYGQSIRMGAAIGGQYIFTNRIILDGHIGLGYGQYYKQYDNADPSALSDGYIDASLWLGVGYCF